MRLMTILLAVVLLAGCVTVDEKKPAPGAAKQNALPIHGKWKNKQSSASITFEPDYTVAVTTEGSNGKGTWAFENGEYVATIKEMTTAEGEPITIEDPVARCVIDRMGQLVLKNAGEELIFYKVEAIVLDKK